MGPKEKCKICSKPVRDNTRAIECDLCLTWCHFKCTSLSVKAYNSLSNTNNLWLCQHCRCEVFPFCEIDNHELLKFTFNSNTKCNCSLSIDETRLSDLSHFDIVSSISNIPNLNDIDPDSNIPSKVNFKYYTPHQFHSNPELSNTSHKSIYFFHCNIRSLTANFFSI